MINHSAVQKGVRSFESLIEWCNKPRIDIQSIHIVGYTWEIQHINCRCSIIKKENNDEGPSKK